ncbi:hypothetical protein [Brevibacillus composti]|uniref:Uncharacterized protein n=1 Tax=Brevibacillus composti TaxID=2796470 RepID=A0A7T5EQ74_9BACL|nr:hypothetical protein [Brevibacillus composti]QQE76758.1 hypothetical protein JD108_22170 [Brevibacillus composti]
MALILHWMILSVLTLALFITYYFTFNSVQITVKKKGKRERVIEWDAFQPKMLVISILLTVFYGMYFTQLISMTKGAAY